MSRLGRYKMFAVAKVAVVVTVVIVYSLEAAEAPAERSAIPAKDGTAAPPSSSASSGTPAAPSELQGKPKFRQREGTRLADQRGKFERRGDRYVFLTAGATAHLEVLENLMLERVAAILDETSGGALDWSVSGTLTEYRGSNYLLLTRAVVKSSPGPNEPHRLDGSSSQTTARPVPLR